jgi:exodeoxyribonuclease-5
MIESSRYTETSASVILFDMVQANALSEALLREFDYVPTSGQEVVINRLAAFISSDQDDAMFVLKGYAGTGKTTLVSALVKVLPEFRIGSILMAPTGRAAKVLAGYSGKPAHTIHRTIYRIYTTADGGVSMNLAQNKQRNTLFIVDEASMISDASSYDRELFAGSRLLEDMITFVRSGEKCRLILIGDSAQLPPVGLDESPAIDLAYLKASFQMKPIAEEMTEVVRQAEDSGILENATRIRELIRRKITDPPFFTTAGFNDVRAINGIELEDALHTAYASGAREDTVIICRSNKRANIFNNEVRNRIMGYDGELNAGDLLMSVKNNYYWLPEDSKAGFIANGDMLEILRVRKTHEMYGFRFADVQLRMVDFPEEKDMDVRILLDTLSVDGPSLSRTDLQRLYDEVMKDFNDLPSRTERNKKVKENPFFNAIQVKFAYALTCHKAQGGQWKHVFVEQGYLTDAMVNIEFLRWLYTAVTRARTTLHLVNFSEKFYSD